MIFSIDAARSGSRSLSAAVRNQAWMIAWIRRTPRWVGSFSDANWGSSTNCADTAIFAAVLDVLKMPNTLRFANSKACLLVIPPDQAYGAQGSGPIGPNETLVFVVDLIGVR